MKDNQAFSIESGGKKIIVTSVRLDATLHELAKRSKLNFRTLLEKAILNEFRLPQPDDPENWSDGFRALIRKTLDDAMREEENDKKRIEILKQEIEHARAKEIADVLTAEREQQREKERVETRTRKLVETFERVMEKHGLSKSRIRRMIPEYDPETNNLDDWLAIEGEIRAEAREWFSDDEIRSYAKEYTAS